MIFFSSDWTPLQAKRGTSRRTSLIVDPPDGKIPPLTPERRRERRGAPRRGNEAALSMDRKAVFWPSVVS